MDELSELNLIKQEEESKNKPPSTPKIATKKEDKGNDSIRDETTEKQSNKETEAEQKSYSK
jgi:hypothetical protein